jgi:hypothetical protein
MRWPDFSLGPGVVEMVSGGLRPPEIGDPPPRSRIGAPRLWGRQRNAGPDAAHRAPWRSEPGEVAVTAVSRDINGLVDVACIVLEELRCAGWWPLIVSAMASHGGGTAGGQLNLLADYVTEAALAVSARATMDTVVIGEVRGIPVHVDRSVASARRSRCRLTATRSAHWVFTAWFSGYHNHSCMLNGRDGMRSLQHLADLFVLTDALGLSLIPTLKDI